LTLIFDDVLKASEVKRSPIVLLIGSGNWLLK